jgi:DNA sulfur modification protein DndB
MWPLRLIPKLFSFNDDDDELAPALRAQRTLNTNRIPEMAQYIVDNPNDYVFSAITASINVEVIFEPYDQGPGYHQIGHLQIPASAKFIINDGQHRRAAIERALRDRPDLSDEHIAVVFFLDRGLERCQQMFADLNRHAIRPAKSLGVLYDHRDRHSMITRAVVFGSDIFRDIVELERSSISFRSRKLFTLSGIHSGTKALLQHLDIHETPIDELANLARTFWETVESHIPEWRRVRKNQTTAGDVRQEFVHSHGIALAALGLAGSTLLQNHKDWKSRLRRLRTLSWKRSNARLWEGRAMVGGRVSKAHRQVTLTANVIKKHLGLSLSKDEQRIEDLHLRGEG